MTTTKTQTTEYRLEASARKADREREAVQAMKEYEAEKIRVDANTARLRALRLAKETAEAQAADAAPPAKPKPARRAPAAAKKRRTT